ncbi:MAG: peroxidase family protein [Elainellaceae cyanobacterium]
MQTATDFTNSIQNNVSDSPFLFPAWFGFLDQNDGNNPTRNNRFFDDFYFQGATPGSQVTLDLASETDTFLQLVNAETGAVIAFDDDSGFGLDSRLSFTVQSDIDYIVRATTFSRQATGSYTLSTTAGDLTPASTIFANQSVEGTLGFTDFINPNREGRTYDGYLLTGFEAGEFVSIDIDGEFDTFLQLVDAETGTVLLEDDDSGLGFNSSLSFTVDAEQDYILQVTSFGFGETGDYTLSTSTSPVLEPTPEAVIEFDPFEVRGIDPDDLNSPTDGFGNNVDNPERGAAGSTFINIAPLDYGDGISTPTGEDRPNAREISNAISQQDGDVRDPRGLTNLIWGWGQFLDHDITLNLDDEHGEEIEIEIPENDPALDPSNVISLRESEFVEGTGTSPSNPRQLPNNITAFVDGSNVYGSDEEQLDDLRTFTGGQLRVSEGNLLPISFDGRPQFEAGDIRANENSVLTSLHTLFVREHNRLADELAEAHPTWTDDQLFERARQLNIAQIQNVTFNEYLPTLLGESLPDYEGYDSDVDPAISRVFANAAFRLGHTQLSSIIPQLNPDGSASGGDLRLSDVFFPGVELLQEEGIDGILRGVASSNSQRVDNLVIEDVRSLLFGEGPNSPARDLAAINIERGRLNGLADYNTVRESFGLSRVHSFADISSDPQIQQTLSDLYGTVDNIDAFVGLLAEDLEPGSSVGETVGAILVDQFARLRDGDRFYFENSLLPQESEVIRQTTLSDIIRRNTDTTVIQDNAFTLTNIGSNEDDTLNGGLGDDLIVGRGGDDTLSGYAGEDNLIGRSGNDHLSGGTEGDRLIGRSGNDYLVGDSGSDTLVGGSGRDTLIGTNGEARGVGELDVLTGGNGRDRFVLGDAESAYYLDGHLAENGIGDFANITDFDRRRDTIQLHGTAQNYELELVSTGAGSRDAHLFYRGDVAGESELIAVLEDVSGSTSTISNRFTFV